MEDQHMEMDMENAELRRKLQETAETAAETAKTTEPTAKSTTAKPSYSEKSTTAKPPYSEKISVNDDDDYLDGDTEHHDNSDDDYLCEHDDISSALWAETHPVLAMERFFSASTLRPLQSEHDKKWLSSIGSLMAYLRKCKEADFAALSAALVAGADILTAVTNLSKRISAFLGEVDFLTAVCVSHAVLGEPTTAKEPSAFAFKAAESVNAVWRAYLKSEPGTVKLLQAQVRSNTVPEALKGVNVSVPNVNAAKFDPVSNPSYRKAHLTMLILIKDALVAAADAHNTPQHLRTCWVDSFPSGGTCDDVDLIISKQLSAYNSLVARTGKHVSDEERVNRLRHCFSADLLSEFNDHLARARIDASCMDWATCVDIARAAQGVFRSRQTHSSASLPPPSQRSTSSPSAVSPSPSRLVFPKEDSTWVAYHKSDLIAFGMCSLIMHKGDCDRENCPYDHDLPQKIDLDSAAWKTAVVKSEAYRARKKAVGSKPAEPVACFALAGDEGAADPPAEPEVPPPPPPPLPGSLVVDTTVDPPTVGFVKVEVQDVFDGDDNEGLPPCIDDPIPVCEMPPPSGSVPVDE